MGIRSLELQLKAAKNLSRPRLDFVSQYRINGFGDNLLGEEDDDGRRIRVTRVPMNR